MTSPIPFTPVTAEALSRLTAGERAAFSAAADYLARDQKPPMETIVTLAETIQRLTGDPGGADRRELEERFREAVANRRHVWLPAEATQIVPEAGPGAAMIWAERLRQVAVEGYDAEHDAEHVNGELAAAALSYVLDACDQPLQALGCWPFDLASFKPGPNPADSLAKAGAMCAAEIDRIVAEEAKRDVAP